MPIITSPSSISQGETTAVPDIQFSAGTGSDIQITGTLPSLNVAEFFEVRDHSNTQNNGLYQVTAVTTPDGDYECNKVSGALPVTAPAEAATTLGATADSKNIFYDTAGLGVYLLEQNGLSADGATGQAIYSHAKDTWKDDSFIIANAPFPLITIDADAGKFEIGTDGTNNNGSTWVDNATYGIRTRKLIRNAGWNERDSSGNITARYFGGVTLGVFEDLTGDTAYYQFGNNTIVDDTVDFDFAGPVNEAVLFFDEIGTVAGCDFATTSTITRSSGSFITDGYKVGGQVTVRAASGATNNGTFELTSVSALTLTVSGTPLTAVVESGAILAVDNDNGVTLRLRVRDADTNGKTFAQANLASAGKTVLGNFVYSFPLANATDLDISATDATITGTTPYTGMSITYYATPQSRAGLVGGSFNFGIIIEANNGTNQQVYEFVQRQLRQFTDIDADSDIAIGRTMDGLMRFVGAQLQVGSTDGGLSFPTNPDGGGSGVYIDNLNATSANDVIFYDNTGTARANPETIAVTLDFNSTIIDDTVAEFDLFYDRTIRTSIADFTITTSPDTISGSLPTNSEIAVNKYIRIGGLTGGDDAMNGVYQITAISGGTDWYVVRYDGAAIVAVTTASVDIDQNCIDTPDAIIVHTNVVAQGLDINFTAPNIINSVTTDLSVFSANDIIEISGATGTNDGFYTVTASTSTTADVNVETIQTETSGDTIISEIVSGIANLDYVFSYDFDGNTQGGRTVSTTTFVKAKAVGQSGSQYAESTVQQIVTGTPLTIPIVGQVERNYTA
jgi:hypothetical protein